MISELPDLQSVKQRFGIIGNSEKLNNALRVALQVAPTDLTVLLLGESGTGKEIFARIIHHYSPRKHNTYIAVNCGAIPEGTINSELFGHEKGAFTDAYGTRKGYFEVADKGTIFLDEVAELPLHTQALLLRVLETGEFMRVGSSKVMKTDVRIIAATNKDLLEEVRKGNFREDLYYRISIVPIHIPPLRERGEDIIMLFIKFASDFAEKYRMPPIELDESAKEVLLNYRWPGNVRQLKNLVKQISILEPSRLITADILKKYLPDYESIKVPVLYRKEREANQMTDAEREILYKIIFELKEEIQMLKKKIEILQEQQGRQLEQIDTQIKVLAPVEQKPAVPAPLDNEEIVEEPKIIEDNLSLEENEKRLIIMALKKHNGKRKAAAKELGISERTLYRKIKEYNIDL